MTKAQFRAYCAAQGIEPRYSGKDKTFYCDRLPTMHTHFRVNCPFKIKLAE